MSRIGLLRICQDLRRCSLLDDATVLHYGNIVADLRRNAQIVREISALVHALRPTVKDPGVRIETV